MANRSQTPSVSAANQSALFGYAWSSNIGWLNFRGLTKNNKTFGVSLDNDTGAFSGYAWSPNIGWVDFGGVRLESNKITGWAKALVGDVDTTDGWDGLIKMSDSNYGVSLDNCNLSGYAWGSDVIGWLSFNGTAQDNSPYGVALSPCVAPPSEQPQCSFYANPDTLVSPQNRSTLYWSCGPSPAVESCFISEGIGSVDPAGGNKQVTVNQTTLFILTCRTASGGQTIIPAVVQVSGQPRIIEVRPR